MAITDTLLTRSDFSDIKEVSTNLNDARMLPYVREAQRIDLTKFFGEALEFLSLFYFISHTANKKYPKAQHQQKDRNPEYQNPETFCQQYLK